MNGTLQDALRTGLIAVLVTTLLVMLVVGPDHAAHSEFPGHEHPPGTPEHTHNLESVTGWMVASLPLVVILVGFLVIVPVLPGLRSWFPRVQRMRMNGTRAPPESCRRQPK